jgi:hypothetical protein
MLGSDVSYALRALTRQKLAGGLVVLMLALGIGANVAVFSLINGLFLRPFPFPEPDRLVYINETAPRWNLEMTGVSYPDFARWYQDQQAFEAMALYDQLTVNVASETGADRIQGASVTADFAKVLGIQPALGRFFTAEEDRPTGPDVVVIGHVLWQERFGGRPDIVGQTMRLNSRPYTIIGVLPREAEFPGGVRFWIAMRQDPARRQGYSYDGLGRLKPASPWRRQAPISSALTSPSSTSTTKSASSRRSPAICASSLPATSGRPQPRWAWRSSSSCSSPARTSPA